MSKPVTPRKGKTDWVALLLGVILGVALSFAIKPRNASPLLLVIGSTSLGLILFVVLAIVRAKLGFGPNAGNFRANRDKGE